MNALRFGKIQLTQQQGWTKPATGKSFVNEGPFKFHQVVVTVSGKDLKDYPNLIPSYYQDKGALDLGFTVYPEAPETGVHFKVHQALSGHTGFNNIFPNKGGQFKDAMALIEATPKLSRDRKGELYKALLKAALQFLPNQ